MNYKIRAVLLQLGKSSSDVFTRHGLFNMAKEERVKVTTLFSGTPTTVDAYQYHLALYFIIIAGIAFGQ